MHTEDTTQVITIANSKGGTGKTTLCVNIAAFLSKEGLRVGVLDSDRQLSSHDWISESDDRYLTHVEIYSGASANEILEITKNTEVDILIIDSQGALCQELGLCLALADIILIPCRPSRDDLLGYGWIKALTEHVPENLFRKAPEVRVVINGIGKDEALFDHIRAELARDRYQVLENPISHNLAHAEANINRVSVIENGGIAMYEIQDLSNVLLKVLREQKRQMVGPR